MPNFAPQTEREMIEILTGIFEGGGYCTLADSPTDTLGGLSYGKHQAAEAQGSLVAMLKMYVDRTDPPLPAPDFKDKLETHLQLYDAAGRKYQGTPAQRADYKQLLKTICNDPAMHAAQDEYFTECYYVPAMQHADTFGVSSPLGRSIFYDISIQAGSGRQSFYRSAIAHFMAQNPGVTCASCKPKDLNGPEEVAFLRAVNAARRSEMLASSSKDYQKSVYRPNEYDKLLDANNLDFKSDFVFRSCPIKGLP